MKTMTELIIFFQMNYQKLVSEMRHATHHLTNADVGNVEINLFGANSHPVNLNPYHIEGNIWEHTLLVCKQAENSSYEVMIAALLHDIGKPSTRAVNPKNGRVSFFNHDAVSAFMSLERYFVELSERLMLDPINPKTEDRKRIGLFCKEHNLTTSAMFAILDRKETVLDKIIMKSIRPFGNQIK